MSFSAVLENQHFNQLAAIFAVSMAPGWRLRHPEVPSVRGTLESLMKISKGLGIGPDVKEKLAAQLMALFAKLSMTDADLRYSSADLDWLIGVIDGDANDARTVLSMLFATAVAGAGDWYSAEQVSALAESAGSLPGIAASTLRRDAANGRIVGARLAGKTWLFNGLALRAYGVVMPQTMHIEENNSEEE